MALLKSEQPEELAMWIKQLVHTIKTRRQRSQWLQRERAARMNVAHLSDHIKKDIGLNNPVEVPLPQWHRAPKTMLSAPQDASSGSSNPVQEGVPV